MNRRGQFFIIAALVIISLLLGLNQVYTEVNTNPEDRSISFLIHETNNEFSTLLVAANTSNYSSTQINDAMLDLAQSYSNNNPNVNFLICYINQGFPYQIEINDTSDSTITPLLDTNSSSNVVEFNLSSHNLGIKTFNINLGENLYINLKKELPNGEVIIDETEI